MKWKNRNNPLLPLNAVRRKSNRMAFNKTHCKKIKHQFMTTLIAPICTYIKRQTKDIQNPGHSLKDKNLSFSKQEEMGENVIALDTKKRKLIYFKKDANKPTFLMIDLQEVFSCTVKKQYKSIDAGALKKHKLGDYLKNIFLQFDFKNGSRKVNLPIFEDEKDRQEDIETLEAKAKDWESIVTNLVHVPLN